MNLFPSPFGSVQLNRLPRDSSNTLRAWDAADEYLLQYLHEHFSDCQQPLIFNDSFGALSLSLFQQHPVSINDSFVSQQAMLINLENNQQTNADIANSVNISLLDSITPLPTAPIAILKLPKNSRYFEHQLQALNHYLPTGTPVIIGAMVKYLSRSFFKLFEQHLTGTHTSLAKKKARLLIGVTRGGYPAPILEQPRLQSEIGLTLFDTPNVFAAGKLDQGSRFFLQHFPDLSDIAQAIDLGCGNGILGLNALQKNPQLQVSFVDESSSVLSVLYLRDVRKHWSNVLRVTNNDIGMVLRPLDKGPQSIRPDTHFGLTIDLKGFDRIQILRMFLQERLEKFIHWNYLLSHSIRVNCITNRECRDADLMLLAP